MALDEDHRLDQEVRFSRFALDVIELVAKFDVRIEPKNHSVLSLRLRVARLGCEQRWHA
jgi:hypothetical protein